MVNHSTLHVMCMCCVHVFIFLPIAFFQAVDHVPKPSVVRFDPNDPNFILGIPEEPASATSTEVAKDGKKVSYTCTYTWSTCVLSQ